MLVSRKIIFMSYKDLSDEELVEMILEALEDDGRVATDFLEVESINGRPVFSGRVSTDKELQIIDEIMNDVLEIPNFENNAWVDDALEFESVDEKKEKHHDDDEDEEEELEEEGDDDED